LIPAIVLANGMTGGETHRDDMLTLQGQDDAITLQGQYDL